MIQRWRYPRVVVVVFFEPRRWRYYISILKSIIFLLSKRVVCYKKQSWLFDCWSLKTDYFYGMFVCGHYHDQVLWRSHKVVIVVFLAK